MTKFCVCCGQKPQSKTKEHVIPRWLIELTGDPSRQAFFDFDFSKDPPQKRLFAFDAFTFPSCDTCNAHYSAMESQAHSAFRAMLTSKELDCFQIDLLLDWFDKVRVGLWLGFQYLDRNMWGIKPAFHISNRIGLLDRGMIVYETDYPRQTLNFIGPECPVFSNQPTSFALIVNHLVFVNVSQLALCDRRLGFPFAEPSVVEDGRTLVNIKAGLERKFYPVLKGAFHTGGSGLFQPIFAQYIKSPDERAKYDTPYVRENSLDWNLGKAWLFLEKENRLERYPPNASVSWRPPNRMHMARVMKQARRFVWSNVLNGFAVAIKSAGPSLEDKDDQSRKLHMAQRLNDFLTPHYDRLYETLL